MNTPNHQLPAYHIDRRTRSVSRRDFLRMTAVGSASALATTTLYGTESDDVVKIDEPFHGAVLNYRHGKIVPGD